MSQLMYLCSHMLPSADQVREKADQGRKDLERHFLR